MNARNIEYRAAKIAEAARYGGSLGRNAAAQHAPVDADGALTVLRLIRKGELAEALGVGGIGERVTARSLARDLGVRPGTALAREMHAAMVAAWGPALVDEAAGRAQDALGADVYA